MNVNLGFAVFAYIATAMKCDDIEVTLKLGSIVGYKENIDNKEVNVFLGIPYAVPPLRDLRFRKPLPVTEKWTSPLNAQHWSNMCMQDKNTSVFTNYISFELSEDCLYLNILSPIDLKEDFPRDLKTVMVFIHGGSFNYIGTSNKHFNASLLSSFGDVVAVTMNYRLGSFGFLFGDNDEAPGNIGLYDQLLALEWVQENIACFGGDANKVTLFGWSAGAWSTSLHYLSPISQDLFSRVIIMSGAIYSHVGIEAKEVAIKKTLKFAQLLGCAEDYEREVSSGTLNCRRGVDAEKMIEVQLLPDLVMMSKTTLPIALLPIFGDAFIPRDPREIIEGASFSKGVDVLLGTVSDEGYLMRLVLPLVFPISENVDWQELLRSFLRQYFSKSSSADIDGIVNHYFGNIEDTKSEAAKLAFDLALGDVTFNCDVLSFSREVSKVNDVYQYLFEYGMEDAADAPTSACDIPDGACHGNELPITFGTASGLKDAEVSKRWIKIFTDFAKTGTAPWPKHGPYSPYYKFTSDQSTDELLYNYREDVCELWTRLLIDL